MMGFSRTALILSAIILGALVPQAHVFAPGKYTLKISEPETGREKELGDLEASEKNNLTVEIKV